MLKRPVALSVLISLAAVMVVVLMLDDPAAKQQEMLDFRDAMAASKPVQLYPGVQSEEITGLEVQDVTNLTGLLVMRNDSGLWYAPSIQDIQPATDAEELNQTVAEEAAIAITLLGAEQWYEATQHNLEVFGLSPAPSYRVRFRGQDAEGKIYESLLHIGDANPDNVAYYVYVPETSDQRIFLVPRQLVDYLVAMPNAVNSSDEVGTPVP